MTSTAGRTPNTNGMDAAVEARLSSFNAVLTLSLILTQASSPDQVMRLVATAVPSIMPCQQALIWHLEQVGRVLPAAPRITSPKCWRSSPDLDQLEVGGFPRRGHSRLPPRWRMSRSS